jgi:hypothetical protein
VAGMWLIVGFVTMWVQRMEGQMCVCVCVCVCVCADSSYKFLSVRKHGSGGFLSVHVL